MRWLLPVPWWTARSAKASSPVSNSRTGGTGWHQGAVYVAWWVSGASSVPQAEIGSTAGLKKLLKKHAMGETLAVLDSKLGSIVKEKMGIDCVYKYEP